MVNAELVSQLQRLNNLFQRTAEASGANIEIRSHWAKYLCIMCAGFLENSIHILYSVYVNQRSSQEIRNFASHHLAKIHNPKSYRFIENARSFEKSWGEELESFLDEGGRKEAINSIMGNRHKIAHGENSDITIVRLREWFDKSIEVVDFIEQQLN